MLQSVPRQPVSKASGDGVVQKLVPPPLFIERSLCLNLPAQPLITREVMESPSYEYEVVGIMPPVLRSSRTKRLEVHNINC